METETYKNYIINIVVDVEPYNPFDDDGLPPTMVFYNRNLTTYGNVLDIQDLVSLIPNEKLARGERVKTIEEVFGISIREFAEHKHDTGYNDRETLADMLEDMFPVSRRWDLMSERFNTIETLCKLANIPYYYSHINVGSQDFVMVFAMTTPAWVRETGVPCDTLESQCKATVDLFEDWATGNCYGIASILDPEGNELPDASVWGFFGSDFEKNGLMDHARAIIDHDIKVKKAKKGHSRKHAIA